MNEKEYLKNRVDNEIQKHQQLSQKEHAWFLFLKILTVILTASVSVISVFEEAYLSMLGICAITGAIASVSSTSSILGIGKFHEKRSTNRTVCELLKREKYLY